MPKPKIILDIAEKAFPKASQKVKTFFKKIKKLTTENVTLRFAHLGFF